MLFLEANKNFRLNVDLASLTYKSSSGDVFAKSTAREFIDRLLESNADSVEVQLLLILDETAFEPMDDPTEVLKIDLKQLRKQFSGQGTATVPDDIFKVCEMLRGLRHSLLDELHF